PERLFPRPPPGPPRRLRRGTVEPFPVSLDRRGCLLRELCGTPCSSYSWEYEHAMDLDLAGRVERQRRLTAALRETLADIAEGLADTGAELADTLEQI